MRSVICAVASATLASWLSYSTATAQQGGSPQQPVTSDPASNPDQELGRRFLVKAGNLPPPSGLHSHAVCHGLGESSPPARAPQ